MRILLIGNSFSRNATRYLPELAAEGEYSLHLGRAEVGGCSLQRHWEHVKAAERGEAAGKFYNGQSLRDLTEEGDWDVITFHQASLFSSDVNSYRPYARLLHDYAKSLCPAAEVLMHQTWAYRCDSPFWGEIGDSLSAKSQHEMWEYSCAAYHTIADELGVRLIPTGDAFRAVDSDSQWQYRPDAEFDLEHPAFPALPNQTHSLHAGYYWNDAGEFCIDSKHASEAGCYLGSLMYYGFLFDASPAEVTFAPPEVPADFAAHLRSVATQTLQQSAPTFASSCALITQVISSMPTKPLSSSAEAISVRQV